MSILSIILAAGMGKRMQSDLPKVLHKIGERTLLQHVLDAASAAGIQKHVIVVGHGRDQVLASVKQNSTSFCVQEKQLGTGHAVLCAKDACGSGFDTALILCGDTPCLQAESLRAFLERSQGADVSVLSMIQDNPAGYGRIVRQKGQFMAIVEEKDCTAEQKKITEINSGIYSVRLPLLFDLLKNLGNQNAQQEYYLTDIVAMALHQGLLVQAIAFPESSEFMGVNTPEQLNSAAEWLKAKKALTL